MPETFRLEITLGNDAMSDSLDIAEALERTSAEIISHGTAGDSGVIRDANGNTVGRWIFREEN